MSSITEFILIVEHEIDMSSQKSYQIAREW